MTAARVEPSILATCVVPWDEEYHFMEEAFREHVGLIASELTEHIYIFGTAGEGHAVTDEQFEAVATAFADECSRVGATPMLGVIDMSLGTVIERIELGAALGIRRFQLSLPAWGALNDTKLGVFFDETCGRFPELSFLHYNTVRGGRVLTGNDYRRLASEHENLVGLKFTSWDRDVVQDVVTGAAPMQSFLTEPAYWLVRDRYECGLLVSLSGMSCRFARALHAARGERLVELMTDVQKVEALLARITADRGIHMDGADEKMLARAHGANIPLRLLPPYQGASEDQYAEFAAGLAAIGNPLVDAGPPGA